MYENLKVPVGISIPYTRGEKDGFFAQTYSVIERSKYNLMMLLMTAKGERPMMPEYGSNLRRLLFDPNITEHVDKIFLDEIKDTTSNWMPDVEVISVDVSSDFDKDPHKVELNIKYMIASVPDTESTLSLSLDAG